MKTTTELPTRNLTRNRNLDHLALGIQIEKKIMIKNSVALAALLALLAAPSFGAELSLDSAPPVVVKTVPVAGTKDVDPALTEIKVTYSKAMQDGSWSWSTWGEENFPETTGQPRYLSDGRTCVLPVKLQPAKFYAIWLNSDKFGNFRDTSGQSAVPYLLTFTTASTAAGTSTAATATSPIPRAKELPGKLVFHGRYRHRSRGADIETPSELWVNESPNGAVNALAQLPFRQSSEMASGDAQGRLTSFRSGSDSTGGQPGYRMDLELRDGMVKVTRRGVRQDWDGKELKVPAGAWFDPTSRPDSYCAANILLRAFAVRDGETKEFRVYDWDNSGDALADYSIQVKHAGKEKVEVPAGTFDANHLVLTQVTSADTWFKKRAGHVTDFWVLDNHVIVRVLRHREPYEMVLLDYTVPEQPMAGAGTTKLQTGGGSGGSGGVRAAADFAKLLNDDQRAVLDWTDRQFKSFFDARTFEGWSEEERAALERKLIDALSGPRSTEYYQAINTLAAMRSTQALPRLREIASERVDRNNRDRWMAIRALGIIGDKESVPELIHLVYHGNVNTRWWAQISLVQITGKNFAKDWNAWGKWWNEQKGQPPYKPEIVRWWNGQPEPDKLAQSLNESDEKFLASLRGKSAATVVPSSVELAVKLRDAAPTTQGIRSNWSAAVAALNAADAKNALVSLRQLAPHIQKFCEVFRDTPLEAGAMESLALIGSLGTALEEGDQPAVQSALAKMLALGRDMEAQVKTINASAESGNKP